MLYPNISFDMAPRCESDNNHSVRRINEYLQYANEYLHRRR